MGINSSKLLSGRVPVTPYSNLTSDRYQFLGLGQAEPSLGSGDANSVLTLGTGNTRVWSNTLALSSLSVAGESNLGNISNVHIFGGTNGQLVQTDGNGNLIFADPAVSGSAAPMPFYIPVGETYYVPNNFQGLFTVPIEIDGAFEVDGILVEVGTAIDSLNGQVIFDSNGELTGNVGFTFDQLSGNLAVPGSGTFTGSLLPSANIIYDLGNTTNRWKDLYLSGTTIYIGTSTLATSGGNLILTNGDGGQFVLSGNANSTSFSSSGGASVLTLKETSITFDVNGNANVFKITGTGANLTGTLSATGNAAVSGILTDNYYYANGQPLDVGGNPAGSNTYVQFNNNSEFGASANFTFNSSTNVLTVVGNIAASNANLGNIVTANYLVSNSGCVLVGTGAIAVIGTAAGIFNSSISNINLGLVANVVVGSTTGNVTIQGNLIANNNVTVTGNVSGNLLTGTLTTAAQPNITSTGTLTSLSVTGNITSGNLSTIGNVNSGNLIASLLSITGNINSGNLSTSGNITSGNLSASGNIISANLSASLLSITGNISSGNLSTSGNITSGNLSVTANVSSGNISASGNVSSGNLSITGNISSGNLSITGNISSGNLSASGNINSANLIISNTIDAVNIKVTDLYSKRTSIPITTNTLIDIFPVTQFRSAKYTMRAGNGTDYQALEVLLVHNNINSIITVYGSLSTSSTDLVAFDTDISAGNVNVYATAVGANTNLNLMGTYVPD
jgi:hypothetical protein